MDDEMAAFRATLAEEEAAAAVFLALQKKQYRSAGRLSRWNHVHKAALWPFICAVARVVDRSPLKHGKIHIGRPGNEHWVGVRFDAEAVLGPSAAGRYFEPDDPLNASISLNGATPDFSEELAAIASDAGVRDTELHLKEEANFRNRLLYASDAGMPRIQNASAVVEGRKRRVLAMSTLRVMIEQSAGPQPLADQCLQAFLKLLGAIETIDFGFPRTSETGNVLEVRHEEGKEPEACFTMRRSAQVSFSYSFVPVLHAWYDVDDASPG